MNRTGFDFSVGIQFDMYSTQWGRVARFLSLQFLLWRVQLAPPRLTLTIDRAFDAARGHFKSRDRDAVLSDPDHLREVQHPLLGLMHKPDPKLPPDKQDKRAVVPLDPGQWGQWLNGSIEQVESLIQVPGVEVFKHGAVDPAKQVELPI